MTDGWIMDRHTLKSADGSLLLSHELDLYTEVLRQIGLHLNDEAIIHDDANQSRRMSA